LRTRAECDELLLQIIHDLRAPLRASTMLAQLLERSLSGKLGSEDRELLQRMLEANREQDRFLARIAEYCQAGEDVERFAPVNAGILLDGAIRTARTRAADLPIDVQSHLPSDLLAPQALQKVFVELLDNAMKFNTGGPIVRVSSRGSQGERTFEFQDNGIGFDPSFSQLIMQPLKRLHSASAYPGFGLGLAISQRIVQALGGRLWAEPGPDAGATFHVSIPGERPIH
jgi:signal transduction histidine kinase